MSDYDEEYDTPEGDEKTEEAGGVLQEVEIGELKAITDLEDKATINDSASMEERLEAIEALKHLVLKIQMEEHHDSKATEKYERWILYLTKLYQDTAEQSKHQFIQMTESIREALVENLKQLMESNGGQPNQVEEAKQPTPWEQLGLSQAEYDGRREEGTQWERVEGRLRKLPTPHTDTDSDVSEPNQDDEKAFHVANLGNPDPDPLAAPPAPAQPAPQPAPQPAVLPGGPAPIPPPAVAAAPGPAERAQQAWTAWQNNNQAAYLLAPNNKRLRRIHNIVNRGNVEHFFEYNDGTQHIHSKYRGFKLINHNFRDNRRGSGRREVQRVPRDMMQETVEEKLHNLSTNNDPLHSISGKSGSLGNYISVKVNPSAIHICIKKGVQEQALKLLADRIMEHSKSGPTRIVLKQRDKRGKYRKEDWITAKSLAKMDVNILFQRLLEQTKNRTRYVNLILHQEHVGGAIHDRIENSESLV